MTPEDYLKAWLTLKNGSIKQSTAAQYQEYGKRICEILTKEYRITDIRDITPAMIASIYTPYHTEGKERTAELLYTVAHMMMADAVQLGELQAMPMAALARPGHQASDIEPIDEADIRALRGASRGWIWALMMDTGIRRGEAAALRHGDIDYQRGQISIVRTAYRVNGKLLYTKPKTDNSIRKIPLPTAHIEALREKIAAQMKRGRRGDILLSADGGALDPHRLNVWLADDCSRCGIRHYTVHQLRHTFACTAVSAGVSMRVLQVLMGHSRIDTTARYYAYVRDDIKRVAIDTICAFQGVT